MSAASILLLLALQAAPDSVIPVRDVRAPPLDTEAGIAALGEPSLRIPTGQGAASLWLLRTRDSVFIVARIPDSTYYWGDDLVISLDVSGDRGKVPGHDDFQWYFRRALDSSVVYRGRAGKWEAPRADPDWRLGAERDGGGWTVSGQSDRGRMGADPADWTRPGSTAGSIVGQASRSGSMMTALAGGSPGLRRSLARQASG